MATAAAQTPTKGDAVQEKSSGPVKVPLPAPLPNCHPKPQAPLTADQQSKYDWLLSEVKSWTNIPSHSGKGKTEDAAPLSNSEKQWLTRECLLRYLKATKWHQKDAAKRLQETLSWRREYGVETVLTAEHISPENETGKQIITGYDNEAHPCHYLNPGRQNTEPSPRQVQHLVFMLERVIDMMPPGQEKLALLINFKQSKNRSNTAPGIGLAKEVLHILQTHYPERLGKALIINVPWIVWGFFKLITPLIDPLTREKLKFNEDMKQYVPTEQLWTEFNGALEFEYDHSVYWPALAKLTQERRAARTERWIAGGKQIGESEDYLVGAQELGVAGKLEDKPPAYEPAPEAAAEELEAEVAKLEIKEEAKEDGKAEEAKSEVPKEEPKQMKEEAEAK